MDNFDSGAERVVEISSPQAPVSKLSLTLTLLLILLIFVGLSFGVGYFLGRAQASAAQPQSTEKSTTSTKEGKTTFTSTAQGYSIVFPEAWKGTERTSGTPGVLLELDKNSVELWLRVEQPYTLAQEQKDAITATKTVKIKVGDKELDMTEHAYNTGGFFSVLVIPATTDKPVATFWLKAIDAETYAQEKEIVATFKFI